VSTALSSLYDPQLLPQQHDFQVFFVFIHPTDRDHIQHEFPHKQNHLKNHTLPDPL